jgi:hypothetical protein
VSLRRRIEPFLSSRRNIVGCALAVVGLGVAFTGVVGFPLSLGVVAALYAVGVLLVPADRTVSVAMDAAFDSGKIRATLDQLVRSIRGQVAPDIYQKVFSIRDSILATLPTGPTDMGDPNVYLIQQTALTYLPQALASYLAVPQALAEHRPIAGGRTAHDVLLEQLGLMDQKLQEVADDLARHDSDRLLANGRFLADRFGSSSLQIGANVPIAAMPGVTAPTPAPAPAPTTSVASPTPPAADPTAVEERERIH